MEETSLADTEPEVTIPHDAPMTDVELDVSPAPPSEDLDSGATPQARDQSRFPPTPTLADAVMYTVKRMPPRANSVSDPCYFFQCGFGRYMLTAP